LIYPAAVTGAEKRGYTEARASTAVRGRGCLTAVSWSAAGSCVAIVFGGGALAVSR
jgi:hypothetical protein